MKVRITFEVDDTDRVAISVASGDGFKQAPRETIEAYIVKGVDTQLGILRDRFQLATREIMDEVAE